MEDKSDKKGFNGLRLEKKSLLFILACLDKQNKFK